VELKLTVQVLLLEDTVHTDVGGIDTSNLLFLKEEGEAVLVTSAFI
jgi:hypothetical protein